MMTKLQFSDLRDIKKKAGERWLASRELYGNGIFASIIHAGVKDFHFPKRTGD